MARGVSSTHGDPPERSDAKRLTPGTEIDGRYRVEEFLGAGGFGQVYQCVDLATNETVAVKLVGITTGSGAAWRRLVKKIEKEAHILKQFVHPNIVRVLDWGGLEAPPFYIAMEYIDGVSLDRRMEAPTAISHEEAATWTVLIAEALHQMHGRGIYHRDVKPSNILLEGRYQTKGPKRVLLADFGLALFERHRLERIGGCSGTLSYMSPEQAQGRTRSISAQSDVYSLGATLYALLTGRPPFQGSKSKVLEQLCDDKLPPQSPREIDAGIPEELERICLKALSKPQRRRYRTAHDMVSALRSFIANHVGQGKTPDDIRRVDRSPLLPYLIDRRDQYKALRNTVDRHYAESRQRPLFIIVHGPSGQAIHEYIDRIRFKDLPRILRRHKLPGAPRWEGMFWYGTARASLPDRGAPVRDLCHDIEDRFDLDADSWPLDARKVQSKQKDSLVFCYRDQCESWDRKRQTLLTEWVKSWSNVPDLLPTSLLVVLYVVEHRQASPRPASGAKERKPPYSNIAGSLKRVEALGDHRLTIKRLPELGNVTMKEIKEWIWTVLKPAYPFEALRQAEAILDDPALYKDGVPLEEILDKIQKLSDDHSDS